MSTYVVYSTSKDGRVHNDDTTFSATRGASDGDYVDSAEEWPYIETSRYNSSSYRISRAFLPFDVSGISLAANESISSSSLRIYIHETITTLSGTNYSGIRIATASEPGSGSLELGDFDQVGLDSPVSDYMFYSDAQSGGNYSWPLNTAGVNHISNFIGSGTVNFSVLEGHDINNNPPQSDGQAVFQIIANEYGGTYFTPRLVIETSFDETDDRGASIVGQDSGFSNREVVITGQQSTSSEVGAYIKAGLRITSSARSVITGRNLYVSPSNSTSSWSQPPDQETTWTQSGPASTTWSSQPDVENTWDEDGVTTTTWES